MPGLSSSTGLIAARLHPITKPKPKKIELSGTSRPAPFTLRPFAGLFNPFPYGCSVLCNHPADCEAKEFVKRAKESWATEGKTLLLPTEMELIRATLLAGGVLDSSTPQEPLGQDATATTTVPEELFRKYTETDSRPLTPTPTLASGPLTAHRSAQEEVPATCNPRERTTLILDLRTASQEQETETLSWHALTLEPPPSPRRPSEVSKPLVPQNRPAVPPPPSPVQATSGTFSDHGSSRNEDQEDDSESETGSPMKRRGKKLKKRKCRRGSAYGQQNEVRGPLEPLETQVSQVEDGSRRSSGQQQMAAEAEVKVERATTPVQEHQPCSFLTPEIIRHLGRELDRETVEEEFNLRRKIALEEALRVKGETQPNLKATRTPAAAPVCQNAPRVFSRQSARFELLDSGSLGPMKPLDYLGKFVFLTPGRKLIFGRTFNKFYEDTMDGMRYIQPNEVMEALGEVMGGPFTEEQLQKFGDLLGDIREPLDFRTWCGVCAVCERLLSPLPPREVDPPAWIERADFEALERRLRNVDADPMLVKLLRDIRDL
ncbi:uncharacterized protein LOC107039718 [Diachasma alloeum]|uniref:uncharacterized protein LOC107039718 n=1 Tax=Diachasma alloeum TaxID=454923 RepID=UPI00073849E3|nr:uncharacterized protein LOC107039718 [Diachasma alloeum]